MRQRLSDLIDSIEKNEGLLNELIDIFLEHGPNLLAGVHRALLAEDSAALYRSVHTLKGSAGTFGAPGVTRCALRLESEARADDFQAANIDFAVLESEMRTLCADLEACKHGV